MLFRFPGGVFPVIKPGGDRRIRTSEVETTDLQSVPFGHSGISPFLTIRAEEGTRTPDLLITNQLLYQLSYFGFLIFSRNLKNYPLKKGLQMYTNFWKQKKINKKFSSFLKRNCRKKMIISHM